MALLCGSFLAAVCAVIKLPLLDQCKITVSSVLLLKSTDSWNLDSSFHLASLLFFGTLCCHLLLSILFSLSSYFSFFSLVYLWSHCAGSNAKLALPWAVSSGWYAAAMKGNTGRWGNKRRNKRDRSLNKEKDITVLEDKCLELNFEM